jgi:adenosine deaminase
VQEGPRARDDTLFRLPKAELHVHLDGSLRPATMLELARERDVTLPAADSTALAEAMHVRRGASLEEYLERFDITLGLMQDADALERIAYELVGDHAAENVRYLEVRFCPALATRGTMTSGDVVDAVLAGLARGSRDHEVETRMIVCALRNLPAPHSLEMAELAVAYHDRGVCAFDLAGAEAGHPVHDHVDALRAAHQAGISVTLHAGEAYGPDSIREALELGHAKRIGHGTRLIEDAGLCRIVKDRGVTLEVCLTSNLQTGAATSYSSHPLRRYFDEGIRISLSTDNRLMSGVTLTREYEHARDELGFTGAELRQVARTGFDSAFVSDEARARLLASFDADVIG